MKNPKNKLNFIVIFLSLLTASCGNGSNTTQVQEVTVQRTGSYAVPTVTMDYSATLRGIDANNNGIRDDIDELILKEFSQTPVVKKAAEQLAKAHAGIFDVTTREEGFLVIKKLSSAISCTFDILPAHDRDGLTHAQISANFNFRERLSSEIKVFTFNTKERLSKNHTFSKLMSGSSFSMAEKPYCE
jgi:hypothetical protein